MIQASTGAKIDLVPLPADPWTQAAFQRRCRMALDAAGHSAAFITAEDIILAKLVAFQGTTSDKHLRDARGVLLMQWGQLDLEAIRRGAQAAGMLETLEDLCTAVQRQMEA